MSGERSRRKGNAGAAELVRVLEAAGADVRAFQRSKRGETDYFATMNGHRLSVESKRQERARIVEWSKQAEAQAPPGMVPVVAWRPSREPWRVTLLLSDLLDLLGGAA